MSSSELWFAYFFLRPPTVVFFSHIIRSSIIFYFSISSLPITVFRHSSPLVCNVRLFYIATMFVYILISIIRLFYFITWLTLFSRSWTLVYLMNSKVRLSYSKKRVSCSGLDISSPFSNWRFFLILQYNFWHFLFTSSLVDDSKSNVRLVQFMLTCLFRQHVNSLT